MITVTSYCNPDLDGVAASYAYAEFLQKTGKDANYYIEGTPKKEVSIVCNLFDIELFSADKVDNHNAFVIVDTNTIRDIPQSIDVNNVIEVIDHHILSKNFEKYPHVKIQIEPLGAVATLIAEKYYQHSIPISKNSAILLYYAIISNSINLHSRNTSDKDVRMTQWLKEQCTQIDDSYINTIFKQKSIIDENNLRAEMEAEYVLEIDNQRLIIAQLEIVDASSFLTIHQDKISAILEEILHEKDLDNIFLNCIDILNGYCILYTPSPVTQNYLRKFFDGQFERDRLIIKPLLMRKEIIKYLSQHSTLNNCQ